MIVRVKNNGAKFPVYQHIGDAGADLTASEGAVINSMGTALIKTGLFIAIPEGYEGQVRSRSGLAIKENLFVLNAPGTIDSNYRGEVCVILTNIGPTTKTIAAGTRIAQLVVKPVEQARFMFVDELDETDRGINGFGSTGTNKELLPFVVNYTWKGERNQFACEAEDKDHAAEQCLNAYPGCEVTRIIIKGDE